ncbi:MAG: hypothetical protein QW258_02715 [Thermoplasmata archaeon]
MVEESIIAYFGKYRTQLREREISKKKIIELVDIGIEMLLNGSISKNPYTEEPINKAYLYIKDNKNII